MKYLIWISSIVFTAFCGWLLTAQILVSRQDPVSHTRLRGDERFDFSQLVPEGTSGLPLLQNYTARDGTLLAFRRYRSARPTHVKLYLLHSAGWQGMEFHSLASAIAYKAGDADVYTPDLRGHGSSPLRRGDITYEGQLADDLADLIDQTAGKDDIVVIGGHSEGGGLAARFAGSPYGGRARGYIFLAPVLSIDFAASRPDLGGWVQVLDRRMLGIRMLHSLALTWADGETVCQYALPSSLRGGPLGYTATTDYSWRLFASMQTRQGDGSDLKGVAAPMLFITGREDSVVYPDRFETALKGIVSKGEYQVVDQENHLGIVNSRKTLAIVQDWLAKLN